MNNDIFCTPIVGAESIGFDSDLTISSFNEAMERIIIEYKDKPVQLIVARESLEVGRIAQARGLDILVLPKCIMSEDAWVLCGRNTAIYSKGA